MKRLILCVILLMISSVAYADVEEFRYFSLNVPENWTAKESGDVVSVSANNKTGSLTITSGKPDGESMSAIALRFSRELNGTEPESDGEGNYNFEFNNGVGQAMIIGDEDFYMFIIATGFVSNAETLGEILESLEMK
ncbi:MAG: hypothetical protein IJR98_03830 [Synergistaceae bacterium]|nr:hypothetical protein [Synergistaceae bacterium]